MLALNIYIKIKKRNKKYDEAKIIKEKHKIEPQYAHKKLNYINDFFDNINLYMLKTKMTDYFY